MFPPLPPGTVVDRRYRVLSLLGSGGMGSVYRALHLGLGREVALKVIHARALSDEHASRLEREARATARLQHAGCVQVIDYGRTFGRHYLAMELIEGPTLSQALRERGRLPIGEAVEAGCQLLDALAHAHARGVLHRDIKPGNVMIDARVGRVRHVLIDFGLAHLMEAVPLTASGICPGTPAYTAPERLLGEAYDGRADLYSLGIVLYELVTGVRPFGGGSPARIAQNQIDLVPPALRTLVQAPAALDRLVMRALQKKPAERFASALEMRGALESVRGEISVGDEESTLEKVEMVKRRTGLRRFVHRLLRPFRPELPTTIPTLEMTTG